MRRPAVLADSKQWVPQLQRSYHAEQLVHENKKQRILSAGIIWTRIKGETAKRGMHRTMDQVQTKYTPGTPLVVVKSNRRCTTLEHQQNRQAY